MNRTWTKEEVEYLKEKWGNVSIPILAKKLNRSVNAVKLKAGRLNLGPMLENGAYVTLNQLAIALTGKIFSSYCKKSWIENRGMPVHNKKVIKNTFKIVYLDEFWKWAEKNRSFLDFSKMETLTLGKEPEWVNEQRKKDYTSNALQRKDKWTPYEDDKLRYLLKQQKYGYAEVAEILHRSEGAIQRRCADLGIRERPVKADICGNLWTDDMYRIIAKGIKNGDSYSLIANRIGKSEKAVRGKVYNKYLTESADKVRTMIGDGQWGDNAPEPKVKQALYLSHTRRVCRKNLTDLVGLLKYRTLCMMKEVHK
ncbi:hypothetical protein [Hominilimicola sp.]|uniref:hypothetical protein n=1 Tax=Hominilimicola sp. TaxID=3073571 RepID=UPI00399F6588